MKYIKAIVTISLTFIALCCRGNAIDSLKTDKDVEAFLRSKASDKKTTYFGENMRDSTSKFAKLHFLKLDLNHDGLTDLLINGIYLFAVIDESKGDFSFPFIDNGTFMMHTYKLVDIDTSSIIPKIIVKSNKPIMPGDPLADTLVYKFGGFTEYNKQPTQYTVSAITAETTACFGECPIFKLTIDTEGNAQYSAIKYNKRKGIFSAKIAPETCHNIFDLINYIRFRSLNDEYQVRWTDDQTIKITVTFADGYEKTISDYGKVGTFGLQRLYDEIFRLRSTQKWKSN